MAEEKKKIPPFADRLVYYVRAAEWPLFVDQHAEAHTLVGGQAVPISRTNRLLTKLLYRHEEKAPSNDGLIGARRVLDMLAHDSGEVRELHTRAAFHEGYLLRAGPRPCCPGRRARMEARHRSARLLPGRQELAAASDPDRRRGARRPRRVVESQDG